MAMFVSNFNLPLAESMTSPSPSAADTAFLIALIELEHGSSSIGSTTSLIVASKAVSPSSPTASAYLPIVPPKAPPPSTLLLAIVASSSPDT
eukprot:CAMPEP_0201609602 /NCGR_PEP_ID=MMETSP0492-20130828/14198_1 /ASSEMBLY_ACC=CAM_ASM_000837 /TAXON_ID=420259 /ORGANISM="Thalassiosira gravida, Strain GMp14c1" /LENGTH=91 /DNA_ID=CAMNT_0048075129 /DNA_START=93 /DNA_END=364 /DNA_ORIENTATION=+